jgi:predicted ATPase with chaperone activity
MGAVAAFVDTPTPTAAPKAPVTLKDTGLSADFVAQLVLKSLYGGESNGLALADQLRLPFQILEPLIEGARAEQLVEVRGAIGTGAATYRYALTDLGRTRAAQFLDANGYVGPAPVPLAAYVAAMKALREARGYVDRERIARGFDNLVVEDSLFGQLGPAINAGKAVFLYGPAGNGKTVLAEGMGRTLGGEMYIPYALEVDRQVITLFDPINHQSLEQADSSSLFIAATTHDRRWVKIRRPVAMVGGELTLDMLDLTFNPIAKFYDAPIQLKANGGVFLVDDFGRQRMRPEELLNRWIVPLESRVDYLTLHTGKKFEVPFDVLIVFATNLDPKSLADEAFLRRIPYKIAITDPSVEQFTKIFELDCRRRGLAFHPVMVAYLYRRHYRPYGRAMRSCQPRDLLDQVTALCRFEGREPTLTRELLDQACDAYFLEDDENDEGQRPFSAAAVNAARRARPKVDIR